MIAWYLKVVYTNGSPIGRTLALGARVCVFESRPFVNSDILYYKKIDKKIGL